MLGKPELYMEILQSFVDLTPEFIQELDDACRQRAWEKLKNIAHAIRGAAGNLSAYAVAAQAAMMEEQLKQQGEVEEQAVKRLQFLLEQVIDSAEQLKRIKPKSASKTAVVEPAQSLELSLQQLIQLLDERSFDTEQLFQKVRPLLEQSVEMEVLDTVERHIRQLNYDAAKELLDTL